MKTVIHLTTDDGADVRHALRCAALLSGHETVVHEDVILLAHREAVWVVTPDSAHGDEIRSLVENGVTVTAGESCFDARDLPHETVPGVDIVPSGVSELVRLQSEGYNYVKVP